MPGTWAHGEGNLYHLNLYLTCSNSGVTCEGSSGDAKMQVRSIIFLPQGGHDK